MYQVWALWWFLMDATIIIQHCPIITNMFMIVCQSRVFWQVKSCVVVLKHYTITRSYMHHLALQNYSIKRTL